MALDIRKISESKCIGGSGEKKSNGGTQYFQQDRVYSMGDVSLCLPSQLPRESYNYLEVKKMSENERNFNMTNDGLISDANQTKKTEFLAKEIEQECVAMRGRGSEDGKFEQRLEPNKEGICNSLTTVQKDNLVLVKQATKQGYIPCEVGGVCDLNYPDSKTRRGRVQGNGQICPTLTTENIPSVLEDWVWEIDGQKYLIRIRKITPKEAFRLMGFAKRNEDGTWDDSNFEKAAEVNSATQLYKQAGNSICVPVLENIFKNLFKSEVG